MKKSILLILTTFLVYAPVLRAGFIWDDNAHVPDRPSLYTLAGLRQIWTTPGYVQQYYPLTFSTVWVAHHFWGNRPRGYHALTLLYHALNAVLVACVLMALEVPAAWGAAFLFSLHPLQVESVAWISEIKNTQSTFFFLLAFLCYWKFLRGSRAFYVASFLLFLAALFSKTTTCVLPVLILAGIFYRRGRLTWEDFYPIIPFFAAGLGLGLTTACIEKSLFGAAGVDWNFSLFEKLSISGRAWWFYIEKLLWPHPLIFMYPKWNVQPASASGLFYGMMALIVLAALWTKRKRWGNGPFIALLAYTLIIGPALGFFPIYPMRYTFVADHYQYVACIPLLTLAASALTRYRAGTVILTIWCLALAIITSQHLEAFQNPETLWRDTLSKNPNSLVASLHLEHDLLYKGLLVEAKMHLDAATRLYPDDINVQLNLADFAIVALHDPKGAANHYEHAVEIAENMPASHVADGNKFLTHYFLGHTLSSVGRHPEARIEYEKALEAMKPLQAKPYFDTTPEVLAAATAVIKSELTAR